MRITAEGRVLAIGLLCAAVFAVPAGPASAVTFSNNSGISIPDGGPCASGNQAKATPYPSAIVASGLTAPVTDVNVTIKGYTAAFSHDVRMLLVGPAGQKALLYHQAGGSGSSSNVTFTLDDEAASFVLNPPVAGTFKPTQVTVCGTIPPTTSLPAPAPPAPYASTLSTFDGTNGNGTWNLYVVDIFSGGASSISGWDLTITAAPQCSDGIDNDGDDRTDLQDLGCTSPTDDDESTAPAICSFNPGTPGNDSFIGDDGADSFNGEGGDDFIAGQGGADCLTGGNGSDVVLGGAGTDVLEGGAGADRIEGEGGADQIYGGAGGDHIEGGDGADAINPEAGADTVIAGPGNDRVVARDGTRDVVDCGPGNADVALVDPQDKVTNCETVEVGP